MTLSLVSPTLAEAVRRFTAAAAAARELVSLVSDEAFHRASPDGGWSVAQCLEHLLVSGGKVVVRIEDATQKARAAGRLASPAAAAVPVRLGWFARFFVAATGRGKPGGTPPARTRTRPAFDPGDPGAQGRTREAVLAGFVALQERLTAAAVAADGVDLAGVKIPSVLASWIRIPLGGWFLVVAGHQERHLDQARRAHAAITHSAQGARP